MPGIGIELLSQKLSDRLLVVDDIEAPEKFTDEEIGIIKKFNPTDIDYDTKELPQEAFWYILQDNVNGYYVNIRFGKKYMPICKLYSWYVLIEGFSPKGKYTSEEVTKPLELPLNIELEITLLKSFLDKYQMTEQHKVEIDLPSEEDRIKYKRNLEALHKIVSRAWNFLHEASQEFQFDAIGDQITELEKKYPNKSVDIKKIENKMKKVRSTRMMFEDAYYQLKSEVAKLIK